MLYEIQIALWKNEMYPICALPPTWKDSCLMTHSFLAVSSLLFTVFERSGWAHLSNARPAAPGTPTIPVLSAQEVAEKKKMAVARRGLFLQGRVRWSTRRVILEWKTKQETATGKFAIYRGRTMTWDRATLVDLSIFATRDNQTNIISYRAVDTRVLPPGPYYYWVVSLNARQREHFFGPYVAHIDNQPQ
jgi:hypothetical protein